MTEKHCLQCGVSIGVTIKRYCSECRAKRDNENRRKARRANRRRNGAKPKGFIPDCVPPYDCMNCRYSDCVRNTGVTRAETEYLKAAKLPNSKTECANKRFPIIDDLIHKRSGRIV